VTSTLELLRRGQTNKVWQKYCGFLDLDIEEFMGIQRRLLAEQIGLLAQCELGRKIMGNTVPNGVDEFREMVPLTTYKDYEPYLLDKREDILPTKPVMWAHTGGTTGRWKWAPLTQRMYDLYTDYSFAMMLLASSRGRGHFTVANNDAFLYAAAPPPYISGIGIEAVGQVLDFRYIPSLDKVRELGFGERIKLGFSLGLQTGIDITGGLAGVMAHIGERFSERERSLKPLLHPAAAFRVIRAAIRARRAGRPMMPRDMWDIKVLICSGMDVAAFRDKVKHYWKADPFESYSTTEYGGLIAMQTWNRKGMTFMPDTGFLEFIPERDSLRNRDDPSYKPSTVLMDELEAGKRYEVVFSNLQGGIFTRYRPGDMIKIAALEDTETGVHLPQMVFEGRADRLIDIGGFSRLNERIVWQALERLAVQYEDWMARKEIEDSQPVIRIYLATDYPRNDGLEASLHEALKSLDEDYSDLESMLGMNPLRLQLLPMGTFARYAEVREAEGMDRAHQKPPHMQPSQGTVDTVLRLARE
jgi:GH3 auxin-responsive promoter